MKRNLYRSLLRLRLTVKGLLVAPLILFSGLTLADALDDAITASQARPVAPLISRDMFIKRDPIQNVLLSPDGKYIAYQVIDDKIRELWLMDLASEQSRQLFATKRQGQLHWSKDSQYLFVSDGRSVHSVSIQEGALPSTIIKYEKEYPHEALDEQSFYGADSIFLHAVIVSKQPKPGDDFILYRVHADGTQDELYRHKKRIENPVFVSSGELAFFNRHAETEMELVRLVEGEETVLMSCPLVGAELHSACNPRSYSEEDQQLYVHGRFNSDLSSLFQLDIQTNRMIQMHTDPNGVSDASGYLFDRDGKKPFLAYYRYDFTRSYGLNAVVEEQLNDIKRQIDSRNLRLLPSRNIQRWLIADFDPARSYARYYLYETATGELSQPLQQFYIDLDNRPPRIPNDHLATLVPVHYQVSDGMQQQGYLTLPSGKDLAKSPLIVMPHGGPFERVHGEFSSRVQLLANRGYIVFQPNFRASTGFGANYISSAVNEFGKGRVQQDIVDGMQYVLSRGIGDPEKLGIAGHSFGGYSVLGALAFTPELFQVGVAGAPPTDLNEIVSYSKKTQFLSDDALGVFWRAFGLDPSSPESVAELYEKSPGYHAEKVSKPLYIWAGKRDDRISVLYVKDYALRQRESGKSVTLLVDEQAGHGPWGDLSYEALLYLYEKALAEHLGGRLEKELSPELSRFLNRSVLIDKNNFL